jgi:DNA primase
LRGILNKILFESLDAQMKEAIAEAAADPTAMQRYKVLFERRRLLGLIPQKLVESHD